MFGQLADRLKSASLIVIVPAILLILGFVAVGINTASTENWEGGAWALILLYFGGGFLLLVALAMAVVWLVKSFRK